jgi:hypothetical protein
MSGVINLMFSLSQHIGKGEQQLNSNRNELNPNKIKNY